jgi:hypothetical protein
MLHDYNAKDISDCAKGKRIVFVGDSTTRQVFWATAKKLDQGRAKKDMAKAEKNHKHTDLTFSKKGVDLEFIWDPYMNTSKLHNELVGFRNGSVAGGTEDPNTKDAAAILIGGGLWHARNIEDKALEEYKNQIDAIVPFIGRRGLMFPRVRNINPPNLRKGSDNVLLFAPVQVPAYQKLSPTRQSAILPNKVSAMNDYLLELSSRHGVEVMWSYSLMTWNHNAAYEESGLHVVENVATHRADILLNMRCNGQANDKNYPHDRTCCAAYHPPGWEQIVGLVFVMGVVPFILLLVYLRYRRTETVSKSAFHHVSFTTSHQLVFAIFVFSGAICYCYIADRSWLFEKSQKVYSQKIFLTLCGLAFTAGTLSLRLTAFRAPSASSSQAKPIKQDQPFLSRDQTDEWKGWMQFVVLIYHYLGASKILWIYQIVRLMVASYLFMTGFGHAVYFYKTDDYSLRRVASVLIRLNLLSCVLPYIMRTDYLFYYFAPLVSFWFIVVYFTMMLGHSRNNSSLFLFGKIIFSAVLTTCFIKIPGILEAVFKFLELTCRIHWDVKEWRFRVFLDFFIVYIGMIVGILHIQITSKSPSIGSSRFISLVRSYFLSLQILASLAAIAIIPSYWALTRRSPNKYDYNCWQPYISCLPILSYVVLRNSHRLLRNVHSSVFGWLGRCSLETFTLQFHIWLAGDTKGLLSLGLLTHNPESMGRWIEFTIITAVFLWTSWGVAIATNTLTAWIINPKREPSTFQSTIHLRTKSENTLVLPNGKSTDTSGSMFKDSPGLEKRARWTGTFPRGHSDERLGLRLGMFLVGMWVLNWVGVCPLP